MVTASVASTVGIHCALTRGVRRPFSTLPAVLAASARSTVDFRHVRRVVCFMWVRKDPSVRTVVPGRL